MITKNDRQKLISLAQSISPLLTVGKNGVTENTVTELEDLLDARELVKVNVLKNADLTAREVAEMLADQCGAEVITTIGQKAVLYKRSTRKDFKHIL